MQGMSSVVEVSLRGNPCEEQARDFATYSSAVRKHFPNLERLVSEEWWCPTSSPSPSYRESNKKALKLLFSFLSPAGWSESTESSEI